MRLYWGVEHYLCSTIGNIGKITSMLTIMNLENSVSIQFGFGLNTATVYQNGVV